jgi:hypothetical protein
MHPLQEGTGIWGSWCATGRPDRIESYMIDAGSSPPPTMPPSCDAQVSETLRQLRGA